MCPCELLSAAITLAECKQSKDKMTHSKLQLDCNILSFFFIIIFFFRIWRIYILFVQREQEQTWNRSPPWRDSVMGSCVGETWAHQDGTVYSLTCYLFILSGCQINQQPGPGDMYSLNDLWSLKVSCDHVIKCNCRGLSFFSAFMNSLICVFVWSV